MKAIILAAGVGRRLGGTAQGLPKSLVPIGGSSLLIRMLKSLQKLGIGSIVVVVGYEKDKIRSAVQQSFEPAGSVKFLENPEYKKGSILSLWTARKEFTEDLLIMDADVLFPDDLLSRLVNSRHPSAFLLDPRSESTGEEMMLMVKGDRVLRIARKVDGPYDLLGEGVGFLKVSKKDLPLLEEALASLVTAGRHDADYENAIDLFLQKAVVGYEPVGSLPWTEVDFPEDIERAERQILPRLK
jgi:choline kinase